MSAALTMIISASPHNIPALSVHSDETLGRPSAAYQDHTDACVFEAWLYTSITTCCKELNIIQTLVLIFHPRFLFNVLQADFSHTYHALIMLTDCDQLI